MEPSFDNCSKSFWEAAASLEERVLVALYENQLSIDPTNLWCRQTLFQLYRKIGAYTQATQQMTTIAQYRRARFATLPQPPWIGTHLSGQTIAITDDWGFGDAIQYIRYLPFLKKQGARILLGCRPELLSLFRSLPSVDQIVPQDLTSVDAIRPVPFDVYASVIDLPLLLDRPFAKMPARQPYLHIPQMLQDQWRNQSSLSSECRTEIIGSKSQHVGLVWTTGNDFMPQRSCHASDFIPLADLPGYQLFSLQKGRRMEEWADVPGMIPLGDHVQDFTEAGAAILSMDLVITVDTATAHLAGALGQEVWVLLPFKEDARWSDQARRSYLYPKMRLYRQSAPGDWKDVIVRVRRDLQRRSENRTSFYER